MPVDTERSARIEPEVLRMPVPVELEDALATVERETGRFARLVETMPDPTAPVRPLKWNAIETAVHVLQGIRYYTDCIAGRVDPPPAPVADALAFGAAHNEAALAEEPEREPRKVAALLDDAVDNLARTARAAGARSPVTFLDGYTRETVAAPCGIVAEAIIHGYDIARATGNRWKIDPASARLGVYSTTDVLQLALNPEAAAGVSLHGRIHVRGGHTFDVRLEGGRVWGEEPSGSPDFHFSIDPVSYLMVAFGRRGISSEILKGRSIAWGRRPWLGLTFAKAFFNP